MDSPSDFRLLGWFSRKMLNWELEHLVNEQYCPVINLFNVPNPPGLRKQMKSCICQQNEKIILHSAGHCTDILKSAPDYKPECIFNYIKKVSFWRIYLLYHCIGVVNGQSIPLSLIWNILRSICYGSNVF